MKTEYLPTFIKDLKKLKNTSDYSQIKNLLTVKIPSYDKFTEIKKIKKIKGNKNAYRLRVGDYRVGFFYQEEPLFFLGYYTEKKYTVFSLDAKGVGVEE